MTQHIGMFLFGWGVGALCWFFVLRFHNARIIKRWEDVALKGLNEADHEPDKSKKGLILLEAVSYFGCANELRDNLNGSSLGSNHYLVGKTGPELFIPRKDGRLGGA